MASRLQGLVLRRPVLAFYLLTFAISFGLMLLVLGPDGFFGTSDTIAVSGPIGLVGPFVAGISLTALISGRAGLNELRSRLTKWRVPLRWYAVALLTAPVLKGVSLLALPLTSHEFHPAIVEEDDKLVLLVFALSTSLIGPLLEETGWTGFAAPRLRRSYGFVATGLIMGLLWGAWHFPMFAGSEDPSGDIPQALYVAVLLFSWLPPYRILMVGLYDNTRSVFLAIVMHAPIVAIALLLADDGLAGAGMVISLLAFSTVLWLAVAAVYLSTRGRLPRNAGDLLPPGKALAEPLGTVPGS